jgi:hypothetical protein
MIDIYLPERDELLQWAKEVSNGSARVPVRNHLLSANEGV